MKNQSKSFQLVSAVGECVGKRLFTRAFSQSFLFFSLALTVFLSLSFLQIQAVQAAGFHETDPIPCYDIQGVGTPVLVNGISNSGVMQFDVGPGKASGPAPQYEGCVRMDSSNPKTAKPDHLEGWVWNSNLGWISLYCGDDNNNGIDELKDKDGIRENLGIACGSFDYRVNVLTNGSAPDFEFVKLKGNAWGDNTGYIAFDNNDWNLTLDTVEPNIGQVKSGSNERYVWADSVGWFDLSGVTMPWKNILVKDFQVCALEGDGSDPQCPCNLVSGDGCNEKSDPNADGKDAWNIQFDLQDNSANVQVTDQNSDLDPNCNGSIGMNTPQPAGNPFYVCITPVWQDLVDYDQTTAFSQNPDNNYNTGNNGPVQKPLKNGDIGFNGKFWAGKVTSFAPTSNVNIDDKGKNSEKFVYGENLGDYDVNNANNGRNNDLILQRLDILVFKYGKPGQCIFGDIVAGNCVQKAALQNIKFKFRPLLRLNTLYFHDSAQNKSLDFINALANEVAKFDYTVGSQSPFNAQKAEILFNIGLGSDPSIGYKFNFEDQPGSGTFDQDVQTSILDETAQSGSLNAKPLPLDPNNPPAFSENVKPYMYSVVSYVANDAAEFTKFFSVKLPRVKAGVVKNPVAFVLGNVYGTSLGVKSQDVKVRSLGNLSSNIFRNNIVQNVYKLIAGYGQNAGGSATVTGWNGSDFTFSGVQPVKIPGKNVYYVKNGDLTFACATGTCAWLGKWTFVVENGHIFVNSNLIPSTNTDPNSAMGLIVIKDLSTVNSKANLYIESAVTDIYQTNIYLDGALFAYKADATHGSGGATANYEPIFADDFDRQSNLGNQFKLYGSLSSANCIGCANANPPVDGNGKVVANVASQYATAVTASQGIASARVADLNYLRYYGPYLELCAGTNTPRDQQLKVANDPNSGCDDSNLNYTIDATQLVTNGGDLVMPTDDVGKASVKAKPTDIYPTIFEQFLPPKDLPGFEVQKDINQTQVI